MDTRYYVWRARGAQHIVRLPALSIRRCWGRASASANASACFCLRWGHYGAVWASIGSRVATEAAWRGLRSVMLLLALSLALVAVFPRQLELAGQSDYGGWASHEGLPAFVYTADQSQLPGAAIPPNAPFGQAEKRDPTARGQSEHSVMLGNDRITLVGSNYGSWRIRQDEGGPKWLTDSDVDNSTGWWYGGGIAFVHDAESRQQLATSTFVPGDATPREWGIGFGVTSSAASTHEGISVRHTVAVLPGAEPSALVEVLVRNHLSATSRNVTVSEVWDSSMVHQLTGVGWGGWSNFSSAGAPRFSNQTAGDMLDRRRFSAAHYASSFERFRNASGVGVVQHRQFLGLTKLERRFYLETAKLPQRPDLDRARASLWDKEPPALFLSRVDEHAASDTTQFLNSAREWYGRGNNVRAFPHGGKLPGHLQWLSAVPEGETALIAVTQLTLPPNSSNTVRFVVGYIPPGGCLADLRSDGVPTVHVALACGRSSRKGTVADRSAAYASEEPERDKETRTETSTAKSEALASLARRQWRPRVINASISSLPWVQREMAWHSFYLQATPTFDSYYNQSIIDQGTAYRYAAGFQGAIRDPLQHALPLIHTRPDLVRAVLKYSLMERQSAVSTPPGSPQDPVFLPDSMIGSGVIRPSTPQPDDFELYLLHLATEYVSATKDTAVLQDLVCGYGDGVTTTVLSALLEAQNFTVNVVGTGPHGLLRLLSSDWDDGFKPPPPDEPVAESVLTSALAAYVLPRWATLLRSLPWRSDSTEAAARVADAFGKSLKEAIFTQAWNGRWLRRAWLGTDVKWVGTAPAEAHSNGTNVTLYSAQIGCESSSLQFVTIRP